MKKTIVLVGIAAVFFLPWLPGFLDQLRVGTTLQHSLPGWAEVVSTPQWKALPLTWLKLLGGGKAIDFTWMDVLYFGIPTISIAILWLKTRRSIHPVLWFWAGFSVLGAWLISFIIPILQPKRVLFALPAVYLAVSQAIFSLKSKKLQYVLIGGAVCYQLLGLAFLWTAPSLQREDWRSTISQLHAQFSPNDTIAVFGFTEPFAPWNFYELRAQPPFPTIAFPKIPVLVIGEVEQYMQPALRYKHVLVFDYLRDLTDPHRLIEQWLEAHDYKGIASLDTKNMGFIRVYERLDQKNSPQKNLALPVPPSVPPPFYTLKNQVQ